MSIAQAIAVARVAAEVEHSLFEPPVPLSEEERPEFSVTLWAELELVHVVVEPPRDWVSIDRAGQVVERRRVTRAEVMTGALRTSPWWESMRRLLRERGIDPFATILCDGFDDEEDEDTGVLIGPDDAVIEWRRRYSDEDPASDTIISWRDITGEWRRGGWGPRVAEGFAFKARGAAPDGLT